MERLFAYEELLTDLAVRAGFVAKADAGRLFERHVLDSARGTLALHGGDRQALDAGSGAGLPGVPVAILRPDIEMTLAETRPRRVAFLELVVERLRLHNVTVTPGRVEQLRGPFDAVFARAFAPLETAWGRLRGLLQPGGRLVYFAGRSTERPRPLPGAASVEALETPVLATSGALIIMSR